MNKLLTVLLLVILMYSCNEKIFTTAVNCEECYQEKPDSADLVIELTFNDKYDAIPLTVYKDKVENDDIEWIDTAYGSPFYLLVPVDKYFSVAAEYNADSGKIIAIDGTKIRIKHVSGECDEDCWIIEDDDLNVKLKYQ